MPRTITFITINYHCCDLVLGLIESLASASDGSIHCIVVDNSPHDPDLAALQGNENVTILYSDHNRGFGGGCNLALEYLQQHDPQAIAWLINPDARLLPGAVASIRHGLATLPAPAVLGTRIQDDNGQLSFDLGRFEPRWGRLNHEPTDRATMPQLGNEDALDRCDWVSGCSMILDLAAIPLAPRFDERIFLYYEDAELCLRLGRQGIPSFVTRACLVSHSGSAVTSRYRARKYRHATFGKLYLLHRHATLRGLAANVARFYASAVLGWPRDQEQALGRMLGTTHYLIWAARDRLTSRRRCDQHRQPGMRTQSAPDSTACS
jgi:N-acetylglucosaminyl-diphospho-decaprenol L-rhamnosyltransferase